VHKIRRETSSQLFSNEDGVKSEDSKAMNGGEGSVRDGRSTNEGRVFLTENTERTKREE